MRCSKKSTTNRGGYTLFEMLMVQALLVVMVAASWPALRSPLGKSQLVDAARQIRVELVKARHKAIETGVAQQFRYQPGTNVFEVAPVTHTAAAGQRADQARDFDDLAGASDDSASGEESSASRSVRRHLPSDVTFCDATAPELAGDAERDAPADARLQASAWSTGDEEWSAPILFHPNGRTSNAKVRLRGKGNFEIEVALRGLTGIPTIGETQRASEE